MGRGSALQVISYFHPCCHSLKYSREGVWCYFALHRTIIHLVKKGSSNALEQVKPWLRLRGQGNSQLGRIHYLLKKSIC